MSCSALDDILDDFCDGRLPADEHAALEAHVGQCADCGARFAREQGLRKLLRSWGEVSVPRPDDAWFDAMLAASAARGKLVLRRRWLAIACGALFAAGVAAFLLAADPVGKSGVHGQARPGERGASDCEQPAAGPEEPDRSHCEPSPVPD